MNETPEVLYNYIIGDFRSAWDGIALLKKAQYENRGNFLFARQSMMLLEFICRLLKKGKLKEFSKILFEIEPRYFCTVPKFKKSNSDFSLPWVNTKDDNLLSLLFDLIRNGQAHQYQQILLNFKDNRYFKASITGPDDGATLELLKAHGRKYHLDVTMNTKYTELIVRPDILFSDFSGAFIKINSYLRTEKLKYLVRTSPETKRFVPCRFSRPNYLFSLDELNQFFNENNFNKR